MPNLRIKKSHTGRGVYAAEAIRKGTLICTMSGTVLPWDEVERRIRKGTVRVDDPFQIAEDTFVLLDRVPRLFNHDCAPNAGIRGGRSLVALRAIAPGEEITYDYSTVVCIHSSWVMRCRCSAAACRKQIRNARSIPPTRLAYYRKERALPRFIAAELGL